MPDNKEEKKELLLEEEKSSLSFSRQYNNLKEKHPILFFISNACLSFAVLLSIALIFNTDWEQTTVSREGKKKEEKKPVVIQEPKTPEKKDPESTQATAYNYNITDLGLNATQDSFKDSTKAQLFTSQLQAMSKIPSYSFLVYEMQLLQKMEKIRQIPLTEILSSFPSNQMRYNYINNYIAETRKINSYAIDAIANLETIDNSLKNQRDTISAEKKSLEESISNAKQAGQFMKLETIISESEKKNQEIALLKQREKNAANIKKDLSQSQKLLEARMLGTENNKDILAHQFKATAIAKMNLDVFEGNPKKVITENYNQTQRQVTHVSNYHSGEIKNESPKRFGVNVVGSRMANGEIYIPFQQKKIPELQLPKINANPISANPIRALQINSGINTLKNGVQNGVQNNIPQQVPNISQFTNYNSSNASLATEAAKLHGQSSLKENFLNLFAGGQYLK